MSELPAIAILPGLLDDAGVGIGIVDGDLRFRHVNAHMAAINGVAPEAHAGRTIAEVIPALAGPLGELVERVLITREPVVSTIVAGSTDAGSDRHWQASYLPLDTPDGPAVGAVVIDVTERVRATETAERRLRQQATVADLGQQALGDPAVEDLLDLVAVRVRDELGADLSGIMFLTDDGDELVMRAGAGWPAGAMGAVRSPLGTRSQAGYCLELGGPVLMRDVGSEDRFETSAALAAAGIRCAISAPIPGDRGPVGVLGVLARTPGRFDDDDAAFLRAVAQIAGAALERDEHRRRLEALAAQRGRLVAQAVEAGEREQRRIADVLQDDVLQHLLSARLELSSDGRAQAGRVRESLERATELVQGITASLDPVSLAHAGLGGAVQRLAADHAARGRVRVEVQVDRGAEGVADPVVLSVVRELLTNVVKHAEAGAAHVRIGVDGGRTVVLSVADDGRGIDRGVLEDAAAGRGLGLAYARERVEALGGSFAFGTGLGGRGTTITATVPAG